MTAQDVDARIAALARRHHQVFNRDQARACGVTSRMARRRVQTGRWIQLDANVFCLAGSSPTWERQVQAARLEAGEHALACRSTAAVLHNMDGVKKGRPHVLVPHPGPPALKLGTVHQTRLWTPIDRSVASGIPATTRERTIIDLAAQLDPRRLERVLDDQLLTGKVNAEQLADRFVAAARHGLDGVRRLRPILEERLPDAYEPPASELEAMGLRRLAAAGLPKPVRQFHLPWRPAWNGWVDLAYPQWRLLLELDGRRWHARMEQMTQDRQRDREVALHRWVVLRYSWVEIKWYGDLFADEVRQALSLAA